MPANQPRRHLRHRRPWPRATSVALSLGLLFSIFFLGLQAAANSPTQAEDAEGSGQVVRPYQAGPLDASTSVRSDARLSVDEEGLALAALIAVIVGFRLSGLARNSARRRRVPPMPPTPPINAA